MFGSKKQLVEKKIDRNFFGRSKKNLVEFFFGLEKIFGRKKKLTEKTNWSKKNSSPKIFWSIFFGRSKKTLV